MRICPPGTCKGILAAFRLEVPENLVEHERGLLGRIGIDDDSAMLFAWPDRMHTFGMRFPIDILWFDVDLRTLVAVDHEVPPGVQSIARKGAYAVEVAGGWCQRHGDKLCK